jgi:hypothetical protein
MRRRILQVRCWRSTAACTCNQGARLKAQCTRGVEHWALGIGH